MIDILDRVRNKALHAKIVSAQEAAELIKPGMNVELVDLHHLVILKLCLWLLLNA